MAGQGLQARLRVAYEGAEYRVGGQVIRIGRAVPEVDGVLQGLGVREATLITAHNPRGRRQAAGRNARAMAALGGRLRRFALLPAESGAGVWREPQFLVAAPAWRLRRLGRVFGQLALVRLRRGDRPALVTLV